MWVAEFEFDGRNHSIGKYAYNNNIRALAYINSYTKEHQGNYLVNYVFYVSAPRKEQVTQFIHDLKAHETVIYLKCIENRIFCQLLQDKTYAATYHSDLIFLEPIYINFKKDGMEHVRIYSWNRQSLVDLSCLIGNQTAGKLKKIHALPDPNFLIVRAEPPLTAKQKEAFDLAIKHGYYHVPRRITLNRLSALMGTNYSTFQVHLRKAERALLPFYKTIHDEHAKTND